MSTLLADLLQARQPQFGLAVDHLELSSGRTSQDVRLMADIVASAHNKTKQLGLDPMDTTAQELYGALMNLAALHDQFLLLRLGLNPSTSEAELNKNILILVGKLGINKSCWAIKHSVMKRIIKSHPPKKVMKFLGFRSIDSMLKREEISKILLCSRKVESTKWFDGLFKLYHKLQPNDFEIRSIEFIYLSEMFQGESFNINSPTTNVFAAKELGCIGLSSVGKKLKTGQTIATLTLVLHAINEVRLYSSYFRHLQTKSSFGKSIVAVLDADDAHPVKIGKETVHWRVLQGYFGQLEPSQHPELFEPHVQPEDLQWRSAEEVLFRLEPALQFWHDMNYVGSDFDEGPVSFNLLDVTLNMLYNSPFERRSLRFMQASLWNELLIRYISQPILEQLVLKQLDRQEFTPELADLSISEVY